MPDREWVLLSYIATVSPAARLVNKAILNRFATHATTNVPSVHGGQPTWEPATTVVFVGSKDTSQGTGSADCCPPDGSDGTAAAAERCCGVMNFFDSTASAQAWWRAHPGVTGHILTQPQSFQLGEDIFGNLMDD